MRPRNAAGWQAGVDVMMGKNLYPDMDKITTLGGYPLNGAPGYAFKPGSGRTSRFEDLRIWRGSCLRTPKS
jgi:hypothetical protein